MFLVALPNSAYQIEVYSPAVNGAVILAQKWLKKSSDQVKQ